MEDIAITGLKPLGVQDVVPKYVLNTGQQLAFDELVPFCLGQSKWRKYTFSGAAGTGKSFTINRVVEAVRKRNPNINFGMTAPTHKAVRVLKKQSELADSLDFGTIHSFLGLKQVIDQKTGDVEYKPDYESGRQRKIDGVNILIVDESSMLDDKLFGFIEDEMRSNRRLKVIYSGEIVAGIKSL